MEYLKEDKHNIGILNICDVSVYILKISEVESFPREYFLEAFPDRLAESKRFVFREDALRSLGVAVLLREVLGLTEKDIRKQEYGKPYTDAKPICFSISHSGDYVVLAVSNQNVGVDVERMDTKYFDIAPTVFTSNEIEWFNEDEEIASKRFMKIWTLKEGVSKITGQGLNTDYKQFTVMPLIEEGTMHYQGNIIIGESNYELAGYCLSVCVQNK